MLRRASIVLILLAGGAGVTQLRGAASNGASIQPEPSPIASLPAAMRRPLNTAEPEPVSEPEADEPAPAPEPEADEPAAKPRCAFEKSEKDRLECIEREKEYKKLREYEVACALEESEEDRLRCVEKGYAKQAARLIERQVAPNDEAARRRGKKTGMGSPDEKPEVIVETLIRAMASGRVDVARFLDPEIAVFDVEYFPSAESSDSGHEKPRCTGAKKVVQRFLQAMAKAEKQYPTTDNLITCSSEFADNPDPSFHDQTEDPEGGRLPRIKHVTCQQTCGGEWGGHYHVEWVPDPKRGWRIGAIALVENVSSDAHVWRQVSRELASQRHCSRR